MRNRKYRKYKGPLVIFEKYARCFSNIPGIDLCQIDHLNVLKLAPGGHVGRFCIWTYDSFVKLNFLFSSEKKFSGEKNITIIPRPLVSNPNLSKVINSDEIQSSLKPFSSTFQKTKKISKFKKNKIQRKFI